MKKNSAPPAGEPVPEFRHVELRIDRFEEGRRLDLLLSGRFGALSRSLWQERIRRGEVTVDGRSARPSRVVRENETVRFSYALRPEPAVSTDIHILYQDDSLLVIDKPPNLPIHASGSYRRNTLNEVLMQRFGTVETPFVCRPVHRLDRETSGIIIYAKSTEAARHLTKSFLAGRVRKEYLVLVFGRFAPERICNGRIGPDTKSLIRKKQAYFEREDGDSLAEQSHAETSVPCRTDFVLERAFTTREDSREISLLRARLHTGRMHQIRATLCSLGYPVVGDRLYGPDEGIYLRMIHDEETEEDRTRLLLSRSALHCAFMAFPHPETNEGISFAAPVPADMDPGQFSTDGSIPRRRPLPSLP